MMQSTQMFSTITKENDEKLKTYYISHAYDFTKISESKARYEKLFPFLFYAVSSSFQFMRFIRNDKSKVFVLHLRID